MLRRELGLFNDNPGDPNVLTREFVKARHFAKQATEQADKYKAGLSETVDAIGTPDDKGNLWYELTEPIIDPANDKPITKVKREKRVSQRLDADAAEEFCRANGLWDEVVVVEEVLDEDKLLALNLDGKITDEQLKSLYTQGVTWALRTL